MREGLTMNESNSTPLAERMHPEALSAFMGQSHLTSLEHVIGQMIH